MPVRRILLVRHGETDGESSIRFFGSTDVPLSESGRRQMRALLPELSRHPFDLVVSSPLRRAWEGAGMIGRGQPVQLEADFREVDFGRWEGLTAEEIGAADPTLYEDWQAGAEDFEYPEGESRKHFRDRIRGGLERLLESSANTVLCVAHKGVIREICLALTGEALPRDHPPLGSLVPLTLWGGVWHEGTRSSNPPGVE